jgi:uncharacterized damage-inducible protein DinB
MIIQSLLGEFLHEAENTRKLLKAITDESLGYKPSSINWTTGQLASHISEIYNWYPATLDMDIFELAEYKYDKGDITKASNIVAKFEENFLIAKNTLENAKEEDMFKMWTMNMNGNPAMPSMMRIQAVRGFLMNHLYHHRGELVVYLRANNVVIPALYGPTYEMSQGM